MDALQERLRVSVQLEEEMQVQAAAIEAARGNVEHHYNYICSLFQDFMTRCALILPVPTCCPEEQTIAIRAASTGALVHSGVKDASQETTDR